ncbi:ribosomal subunit interface protein [Pseudomonas agarici]|uniref:Ribosomal subunit interface protein n=1 Tax=Pseudomonas agarici TaxID=46677 RepID=A0A0X1SXZ4_PSEAA|nr:HPF/RaiA family ribosome-associated protein [Pseudomonas agarici]AMB84409.1 ribosomal subunit interface protein [Pseudomonas agarici]NWB89605.1 HPF/RaiA family ribosome-associated protein [Pseudomonas agarici]NWC10335.1 HPF/RaiA family ribosome-associated protein [Pseudomonas agarici]SEK21405.1 ribosomal subunit interface protein [Pseudomonas agarici]
MQIQVNSDNHIQGSLRLKEWVRTTIESALERYEQDLTRVEIHLKDENGDKPGPHDMRCQIEARPKNHQPISVTHKADTLEQAIDGAAIKLERALEHLFGKLQAKRATLVNGERRDLEDALLEEEFEEKERVRLAANG